MEKKHEVFGGADNMTLQERAEKAVQLKTSGGYNCSQAVTAALADQTNLTEEQLKQVSAGFCAGMGNQEATCGAIIGAGMIAGLKTEGKGTLKIARNIQETFRERCGAITCKDLKKVTDGKPLCSCEECVRNAVLIYGEIFSLKL
jgi:C_GCAxxG_C_C family probable redox protein